MRMTEETISPYACAEPVIAEGLLRREQASDALEARSAKVDGGSKPNKIVSKLLGDGYACSLLMTTCAPGSRAPGLRLMSLAPGLPRREIVTDIRDIDPMVDQPCGKLFATGF